MKPTLRYPEFIGLKVPTDLLRDIRRKAEEDERTVSAYLRRVIRAAIQPETRPEGRDA